MKKIFSLLLISFMIIGLVCSCSSAPKIVEQLGQSAVTVILKNNDGTNGERIIFTCPTELGLRYGVHYIPASWEPK